MGAGDRAVGQDVGRSTSIRRTIRRPPCWAPRLMIGADGAFVMREVIAQHGCEVDPDREVGWR